MEATSSLSSYSRLLRENPNFRLLWYAQIVSELGDGLSTVVIYSMLLEFTGSAQSVAIAYVLQVLPQFFVAPAAGVLNDRLSRKRIMIFADWARALIVFGHAAGAHARRRLVPVRPAGAGSTVMWALFEPGRNALVPEHHRAEAADCGQLAVLGHLVVQPGHRLGARRHGCGDVRPRYGVRGECAVVCRVGLAGGKDPGGGAAH